MPCRFSKLCVAAALAMMPLQGAAEGASDRGTRVEYRGDCTVPADFRSLLPDLFRATEPPPEVPRLFADFEQADALFLAYTGIDTYDGLFVEIVAEALLYGAVEILVAPWDVPRLETLLENHGIPLEIVQLVEDVPFDSVWLRDYGPKAIEASGGLAYVDSRYFVNCLYDDAFPSLLASFQEGRPIRRTDLVLEGGDLTGNGAGVCFTTTHTLPDRAPGVHDDAFLRDWFGCERTVVLEPLAGNAVEHVDMFLVPGDEDVLLLGEFTAEQDPTNREILDRNQAVLSRARTMDDRPFTVLRVPMPDSDRVRNPSHPVVRSYLSLLIFNGLVLVPVYDDSRATEAAALATLRGVFRDREVVALEASELAGDNGAIHCITWTMPAVSPAD